MSFRRLLGAWLVLAIAMPLNGAFRELVLKMRISDPLADTVSAVLGIMLILIITRVIFRIPAETPRAHLVASSVLLVLLTVLFETVFGLIEGQSAQTLLAHYAIWDGEWWPLVLLVLAATPFLWRGRNVAATD